MIRRALACLAIATAAAGTAWWVIDPPYAPDPPTIQPTTTTPERGRYLCAKDWPTQGHYLEAPDARGNCAAGTRPVFVPDRHGDDIDLGA